MNHNTNRSWLRQAGRIIANISTNSNAQPPRPNYRKSYLNHKIKNSGRIVSQGEGRHWCILATCITAMKILGKNTEKTIQQVPIDVETGLLSDGKNLEYVNHLFSLLGYRFNLLDPKMLQIMYLTQFSLKDINVLFHDFNISIIMPERIQSLFQYSTGTQGIVMLKFNNPPHHSYMCLIDHIYATDDNGKYKIWVYNPSGKDGLGCFHMLNINNINDLKCDGDIKTLSLHQGPGWEFLSAYIIT